MTPDLDDARFQPGAYITDNRNLYEVVALDPIDAYGQRFLRVENTRSGRRTSFGASYVVTAFRLVQPAPKAPDNIEEALCPAMI